MPGTGSAQIPLFIRESGAPMEHLWSRAGANGGDGALTRQSRNRLRQAEFVAAGCH